MRENHSFLRVRVVARRIALACAVLLVLYPVAYLLLRATDVLVHRVRPTSTSWIPGEPISAEEFPPPVDPDEKARILFHYEWHDVGRGSAFEAEERWGEKGVVALFRPLVECEMIARGFREVPVTITEMRWSTETEPGKPPDDLRWIEHETRRCSRWEFGAR